ncbi:Ig-like domain-containing protein [Arthrobacter roseus]|uniref:Ig-like domain-containing protein n=1 Tax=Arthrobacter roseus TaxID=136274 RepID=UPI0019645B7B|nr:Ig-like domain-containing protein [Arthrobacter roseus]MBM7848072.1 hypothetical protein [Arthrobacter roseus]
MGIRFTWGRSRAVSALAFGAAASVAVTGAVLYPGFKTAELELHDGGVWVTNNAAGMVGHLNYQSKVLDGGFVAKAASFDVIQDDATVFMTDQEQSGISTVDVATVTQSQPTGVPGGSDIDLGTETVAITDPVSGSLWAVTTDTLASFSPESIEPLVKDAKGLVTAVGEDDTIYTVSPETGQLTTFVREDDGSYTKSSKNGLSGFEQASELQIAAAGDTPVVLDADAGRLYLPGESAVELEGTALTLQLSSRGESINVAVAGADALFTVPLDGGDVRRIDAPGGGQPAAPAVVDQCVHSAWAGSQTYIRSCADPSQDKNEPIPSLGAQSELSFRVNRDVVVLNDMNGGSIWLVTDQMQVVDNWDDLIPPPGEDDKKSEEESNEISRETALPDRTKENRKPVAEDDEFGVRPGRTTVLPILFNDSDPDGDLLTAKLDKDQPKIGTVQSIYNKTGLQIVVPPDAEGSETISYTVDDGRGGEDTASVRLRVVGAESNGAPVQERKSVITVEQGGEITQNILTDWVDPDSDPLQLVGAAVENQQDIVRTRADGVLTFQDVGLSLGEKTVAVTVSDGRERTTSNMTFKVEPAGKLPPVANADHVRVSVGEDATISPLKNDTSPTDARLRLAQVDQVEDATVTMNSDVGTITFRSAAVGTFYLTYLVSNGPASATGLIRVDVEAANEDDGAPVAVHDTALLPAGGETLVDVLGNDSDPSGGVLVVQSVTQPSEKAITVSVVDHSVLRITDTRGLAAPAVVKYTVSNGLESSVGEVSIVPVPRPAKLQPPRANPDEVTVRVNDVVTIPVLANDEHPNGAPITLVPELVETVDDADGLLAMSGEELRFRAGSEPKTVRAIYAVAGPDGQESSAQVTIHIQPLNVEDNSPPQPKSLTGRVFEGQSTRIAVPLDSIDPDGDSVTLIGIEQSPAKGAAKVGASYIDYTAGGNTGGTDTFSYVVSDRLGVRSTATVSVGIAPKANNNQPPVALDDSTIIRPGRTVAVDVLKNDTDADGDRIVFAPGGLEADESVPVSIEKGKVLVTAPEIPGHTVVRYTASDGRGGTDTATLTVDARADAPLLAPIARDDRFPFPETVGETEVTVPFLKNDEDPDGVVADVSASLPGTPDNVSLGEDGTAVVQLTAKAQIIPYTLTDLDGLSATAFMMVPGSAEPHPTLKDFAPLEVQSGEKLTLELDDLVKVRNGRAPRLTAADGVTAVGGEVSATDADTMVFTSAEGYSGPASVVFEVTDGSGPDDPDGLKSTLSAGITVLPDPEENLPPTLAGNTLEAAQGEAAATLDLRQAASDPNPEDVPNLEFALTKSTIDGVQVSLNGSVLSAKADADAPKGNAGSVTVSVSDGTNEPVSAVVDIIVLATDRPLPVANDDVVPEAESGKPVTVNVLENDVNPFPDEPLKIISAATSTGQGSTSVNGSSIEITPAQEFVGTMTVTYRVQDRTGDPEREVDGQVLLTVKSTPDAPLTPVVERTGDQLVVLSWDPPANNGSAITGYTVTAANFSQQCSSTTCELKGLTNNVEYTFTVVAANALGESEPSSPSAVARPDVRPEAPAAPVLTLGDSKIAVSWNVPVSKGSPVKAYNLEISPAPANGVTQKTGVTGTSVSWGGLTNGTAYQIRAQAVNDASEPSDWSPVSAAETPAGPPAAPLAPRADRNTDAVNGGSIVVSWKAPANNGAPLQSYDVRVYRDGSLDSGQSRSVAAGNTGLTLTGLNKSSNYRFAVLAKNKAGASGASAQSGAVVPFGIPGAVGQVSAKATGEDGRAKLNFSAPAANGSAIRDYQVSVNGGSWQGYGGPGSAVNGLSNGNSYSFRVRARNEAGPGPASGPSNAVTPFGPLRNASNIGSSVNGFKVTFTWEKNGSAYANGKPGGATVKVSVDGNSVTNSGSWSGGNSPEDRHDIRIDVCRGGGDCRTFTASERSASPTLTLKQGKDTGYIMRPNPDGDPVCGDSKCNYYHMVAELLPPNTMVTFHCYTEGTGDIGADRTVKTSSRGYAEIGSGCLIEREDSENYNEDWNGFFFRVTTGDRSWESNHRIW